MNILETIRERFARALAPLTPQPTEFAALIRPAGDPKFGDFQANCCMPLSKQLGRNTRELATEVVANLDLEDLCLPPEIAGPGFINLRLRDDALITLLQQVSVDPRLGVAPVAQPRHIIVDYSSPNVAKPMHVGHLRSTVIGAAVCRLLRFLGHRVTSDNHIGDWGTQFGMIIYGYKHFRDEAAYAREPVAELARLYRLVNQLGDYHASLAQIPVLQQRIAHRTAELESQRQQLNPADKAAAKAFRKAEDDLAGQREELAGLERKVSAVQGDAALLQLAEAHPQIARLSREETAKLHAGDPANRGLWEQFLPQCLGALQRVYDRLGIQFDLQLGESYYDAMLGAVVASLRDRGLARESHGAQCVFVEGNEAPFIVQKSDGAFTYATTDLATIRYRVEELQADEMLYVVDARQGEHFKLLFATARAWGYEQVRFAHVSFGTVMGPDKKPYKTRAGDTVGLESLLDEAVAKALEIVSANDDSKTDEAGQPAPELDAATRARIAEIVGLGGIKYADLHHNRDSDYVFDWNKMLAMTGDTAAYMQYAYARVCGILRKGEVTAAALQQATGPFVLSEPAERALALRLCRFEEALTEAASDYRPHLLTQYLFDLAGDLTTFYANCPVLKGTTAETRLNRLRLVELTGRIIRQGLALLGIEVSERM